MNKEMYTGSVRQEELGDIGQEHRRQSKISGKYSPPVSCIIQQQPAGAPQKSGKVNVRCVLTSSQRLKTEELKWDSPQRDTSPGVRGAVDEERH